MYILNTVAITKKKVIYSIIAVAVVLIVGEFIFGGPQNGGGPSRYEKPPKDPTARREWLASNIDNNDPEKFVYLDYKVPSWTKLKLLQASISKEKKYPAFMKAIQEYGSTTNTVDILDFSDELKNLGINTYFVAPSYSIQYSTTPNELEYFYSGYNNPGLLTQDESERALVHTILMAKQNGMTVILFPDYFELEDGGLKKLNISNDLEDRLEKIALELAQIAEDYNVEYFVPVNQIEMILSTNGYNIAETTKRTNAFYARVVPKIRKIYSGKIMYKMGGFNNWSNYANISLEGADLFGFTGCYSNEPSFIIQDTKIMSQMADKLSAQYNVPWMNAEFLIRNTADQARDLGGVKTDLPIEQYYKAGLDAFAQYATNAVGFTVHSYLGSGKVRGTKAIPLIKSFFNSKP